MSAILQALEKHQFHMQDIWVSGANFAYRSIEPTLDALPEGASVLEVGCGGGILMAMLSERRPDLHFTGIEPFGDGFTGLAELTDFLRTRGMTIHKTGYEDFTPTEQYDFIYLVNVFEHLPDWRDFLQVVQTWLKPTGTCIILCPNYDFPFEPHFNRPTFGGKDAMAKRYAKRITFVEDKYEMPGLWDSLNFVKLSEVKAEMPNTDLTLTIDPEITDRIVERLDWDQTFKDNMAFVGGIGKLFKRLGILRLLRTERLEHMHPYMFPMLRRSIGE
jgi:SAM-dependent methyltransferase